MSLISEAEVRCKLRPFPDTDAGNAEAFELLHGPRFRFDHTRRKWLVWNGRYWATDEDNEADRAALETARARRSAAAEIANHDEAKKRLKWAFGSESVWGRRAMLQSAQSISSLATTTDQYDRDPFLLTVGNGTLDLRTGELRDARPEDLITRATDVPYDPTASCPRWLRFQEEVFAGDTDLIDFIWRAVGYTLTGDTREQCLFIPYGQGSNGKTTFMKILLKLLGKHACVTPFSTFLVQRDQDRPRNDLAALYGARLVKASEARRQAALDEAVIKQLTGEDTISARFLYGEFFRYKPQFKIWLATNHKPIIRDTDDAIWRRPKLIPFKEQFKGTKRDPELFNKLVAELPGILAWAAEGCLLWQAMGLEDAPSVESATSQYRRESDQVGRFLEECCLCGREHQASGKPLYEAFVLSCEEHGEKPEPNNIFARALTERGITKKRGRQGIVYLGVGLLPAETVSFDPRTFTK